MRDTYFVFVDTGVRDNEAIIRSLISKNKEIRGFKLRYTPPYEDFKEIKKFQEMAVYQAFETNNREGVIIAVDLEEWYEHQNDEYLEIFFRFLHDYEPEIKVNSLVFSMGDKDQKQAAGILNLAYSYLGEGNVLDYKLMSDKEKLSGYIKKHTGCDETAAKLLAEEFVQQSTNYTLMNHILNDLNNYAEKEKQTVTVNWIETKLSEENNMKLRVLYADSLLEKIQMDQNSQNKNERWR